MVRNTRYDNIQHGNGHDKTAYKILNSTAHDGHYDAIANLVRHESNN